MQGIIDYIIGFFAFGIMLGLPFYIILEGELYTKRLKNEIAKSRDRSSKRLPK